MPDKNTLRARAGEVRLAIPAGIYCYDAEHTCPFWDMSAVHEEQENGYCYLLGKGDWEIAGFGLLWDQCKECGINDDKDAADD